MGLRRWECRLLRRLWFFSRRSCWRTWPWRQRAGWGVFPCREPWSNRPWRSQWRGPDKSDYLILWGLVLLSGLFRDEAPELVDIDSGSEVLVFIFSEHAHALLTEVAGMEFVHQDSVVMLATGVTSTAGVLSVLAHTSVPVRHVPSHLSGLLHSRGLKYTSIPS